MKKFYLIITLTLTCFQLLYAQIIDTSKVKIESIISDSSQANPPLVIIAKSYQDSVVLRWAPGNAILWKYSNQYGYILNRYKIDGNSIGDSTAIKQLSDNPILPWKLEEWKRRSNRNDSLAAIAAQILYGKHFNTSTQGGLNLDAILQQKADEDNRYSYALIISDIHPFAANGLGLRWVDRNIKRGSTYLYTIYSLVPQRIINSDTAAVIVRTNDNLPTPQLPNIKVEVLDRAVRFSWNSDISRRNFSAYFLERSDDLGKTFHKTSNIPFMQKGRGKNVFQEDWMVLNDSLPQNYKKYIYRIIGITPFGEKSKPSDNMLVIGKDKTPPSKPENVKTVNTFNNRVEISWEKKLKEKDFLGFIIGRSQNINGPYIPLFLDPLNKNAKKYTDTSASLHGTNFYVVSAIDTAGNASASTPTYVIMNDSIPPAKPKGLTGKIDTNGIVTLQWKKGNEEDLLGYLVYYSNSISHVFTPITKDFLVDTTFVDTISLNSLTPKVYYKIAAFDMNRNPSEFSDVLILSKPDTIRPVPPVITHYTVTDSSVYFQWIKSSSEDADSQYVYRKVNNKDEWQLLAKLDSNSNAYKDTTVKKLKKYIYAVETMDLSKLKSRKSFPLNVRVYDSGLRDSIHTFSAIYLSDKNNIELSWNYLSNENDKIIIYRNYNNSGMQMYDSVPGNISTYKDMNIPKGNYQYAIKIIFANSDETPLSKITTLNVTAN